MPIQLRVCCSYFSSACLRHRCFLGIGRFRDDSIMHDLLSTGVTCFLCYHKGKSSIHTWYESERGPLCAGTTDAETHGQGSGHVDRSHSGLRGTAPRCEVVRVTCAKPPLPPSIRIDDNAFINDCQVFFVTNIRNFSEKKQGHQPCRS
jgi:hypothetical protein